MRGRRTISSATARGFTTQPILLKPPEAWTNSPRWRTFSCRGTTIIFWWSDRALQGVLLRIGCEGRSSATWTCMRSMEIDSQIGSDNRLRCCRWTALWHVPSLLLILSGFVPLVHDLAEQQTD